MLTTSVVNYLVLLASIPAIIKFHDDIQMWGDYLETTKRPEYVKGVVPESFDFIVSKSANYFLHLHKNKLMLPISNTYII